MNNPKLGHDNNDIIIDDKPPPILYKYARWDREYHKRLITMPEIYFASAREFNDPFDCGIYQRYDLVGHPENMSLQKEILEKRNGIFALSSNKENILMWSHYSNAHRGFCIGYHSGILKSYLRAALLDKKDLVINLFKILYEKTYPVINPAPQLSSGTYGRVKQQLSTKYNIWNYEDEWRYVLSSGSLVGPLNERVFRIPIEAIAEINLGLQMQSSDIAEIIFELKRLKYAGKIYRASKEEFDFRLKFEKEIIL